MEQIKEAKAQRILILMRLGGFKHVQLLNQSHLQGSKLSMLALPLVNNNSNILMQKMNSKAFYLKNFLYKKRTITEPQEERRSEMTSPNRSKLKKRSGLNRRKEGVEVWPSAGPYNARHRKYSYDSKALKSQNAKEGSPSQILKVGGTKKSVQELSMWQSIFHKNVTKSKYFEQFPAISIELSLIKPKKPLKNTNTPNAYSRIPTRNSRRISTANTSQLKAYQSKSVYQANNNNNVYQVHNACVSSTPKKKVALNRSTS